MTCLLDLRGASWQRRSQARLEIEQLNMATVAAHCSYDIFEQKRA